MKRAKQDLLEASDLTLPKFAAWDVEAQGRHFSPQTGLCRIYPLQRRDACGFARRMSGKRHCHCSLPSFRSLGTTPTSERTKLSE